MLQEFKYLNQNDEKEFRKKWNDLVPEHPNLAPIGLKLLTEKEFAQSHYWTYSPDYIEFRQFHPYKEIDGITIRDGRIYYMHDNTGYLISHDYYAGRIYYFKFGCNHQYKEDIYFRFQYN